MVSTRAVSSTGDVSPRQPLDWLKDLQGRVHLWTSADAHDPWKRKSRSIWSCQQREQSASRLSAAADQEVEGSGGSTAMLRAKSEGSSALDAVSDRRDTRGCNDRQSPGFDRELGKIRTLRPRRLTRRPLDTRRIVTSQLLGPGSRHARSRIKSTLETYCRGDDQRQGRAPCQRRQHYVKAEPCCVEGDPSSQTAGSRWSAGAKDGVASRDPTRTFVQRAQFAPATVDDVSRQIRVGGPFSLHCCPLSPERQTEFTKFGEEIATARSLHASKRCRIPVPASPRRRARRNRHETRARILALVSCCLVRLSTGGFWGLLVRLSHCLRVRSEAFAVVPLQRAKISSPLASASPLVLQLIRCWTGFPHAHV